MATFARCLLFVACIVAVPSAKAFSNQEQQAENQLASRLRSLLLTSKLGAKQQTPAKNDADDDFMTEVNDRLTELGESQHEMVSDMRRLVDLVADMFESGHDAFEMDVLKMTLDNLQGTKNDYAEQMKNAMYGPNAEEDTDNGKEGRGMPVDKKDEIIYRLEKIDNLTELLSAVLDALERTLATRILEHIKTDGESVPGELEQVAEDLIDAMKQDQEEPSTETEQDTTTTTPSTTSTTTTATTTTTTPAPTEEGIMRAAKRVDRTMLLQKIRDAAERAMALDRSKNKRMHPPWSPMSLN